jgi:non-ribosomal peptide synthetase component F
VQYRHFAEWQRVWLESAEAEKQRSYWRAQLRDITELPLRADRPRPPVWSGRGARCEVRLPSSLCRKLKELSRSHGTTLFTTLLAAFAVLLHRYTKHEDIAIGSLIANRNRVETENLIGMFANTIVLRTDVSDDPEFGELLHRVRRVTLDAYRNQDLPIEESLSSLDLSRGSASPPLFQAMFILQNAASRLPKLKRLRTRFVEIDPGIARCDLTLELIPTGEGLGGFIEYSTDLFDAARGDCDPPAAANFPSRSAAAR